MKYIRTKDGIYEVVGFDDECIIPSPIIKINGKLTHCSGYKNCKQADTIDELCDKFVVRDGFDKYCLEIDSNYESLKNNNWLTGDWVVYGAIWTDKGLIYVAKMNENGALCLI